MNEETWKRRKKRHSKTSKKRPNERSDRFFISLLVFFLSVICFTAFLLLQRAYRNSSKPLFFLSPHRGCRPCMKTTFGWIWMFNIWILLADVHSTQKMMFIKVILVSDWPCVCIGFFWLSLQHFHSRNDFRRSNRSGHARFPIAWKELGAVIVLKIQ